MKKPEYILIQEFQSACEWYFKEYFRTNRFLYYDLIPHQYFGTDYSLMVTSAHFNWNGTPRIEYSVYTKEDHRHGQNQCVFRQECAIAYQIQVNSLTLPTQTVLLHFYAHSFEPFGETIHPTLKVKELEVFDQFRDALVEIKKQFNILNIDEAKFGAEGGFGFYTDVIRRNRQTQPRNSDIKHAYFYFEIANCHAEIEECTEQILLHQKYTSNLLGRQIISEGQKLYLPNLSYIDFQYLMWVGFSFDRLYSFWDRITFLLHNYEDLRLNQQNLSFFRYMKELNQRITQGTTVSFNSTSPNLKWLLDFFEKKFIKITDYRHRIVHYQFTPGWDGTLSSRFANNSAEYINNQTELNKLKLEFEGLGNLIYQQFNFCKEGFLHTLALIDELP